MRRFSAGKKAYLRNTYLRCIYIGVVYSIVAGKKHKGKAISAVLTLVPCVIRKQMGLF